MAGFVAAIVLVGGHSTRMGTDKAQLVVNGQSMLEHVRAVLYSAGVDRHVIAGSHAVPDPGAGHGPPNGPLAGIVSGWRHLREHHAEPPDPVLVLSCDLPALVPGVIEALVRESLNSITGAVADDGERRQPLIAAYRPAALDAMVQAYEQGERSVRRRFDDWDLVAVRFDPQVLTDADSPEDLQGFDVVWPDEPNELPHGG